MSKSYRFPVFLVLLAVVAVSLVGCLKPGGNDSSSAPPSILAPDTTNTGLSSQGPDVVFKATNVTFSHDKHVTTFKRNCVDCHKAGTLSTTIPWEMSYKDGAYKMADLFAGKGCGICHKSGGAAFDCNNIDSCKRCHANTHEVVNAGEIGSDSCVLCHSAITAEYQTYGVKNTSHAKPFATISPTAVSNLNKEAPDVCLECHFHESASGKAAGFAVSTAQAHMITCQTCHYPNNADGGDKFEYRLVKDQKDLCVTCHHSRWVYGDQPGATSPFSIVGFPTLRPYSTTATSSFPVAWYALFYGGDASAIASATNSAAVSTSLAAFTPKYATGGRRPHESGDYDVLNANVGIVAGSTPSETAPTSIPMFTKDLDGNALTYGETNHRQFSHACVECHMYRNMTSPTKTDYGHTFQATTGTQKDAGCVACHTKMGVAAVDVTAKKKIIQDLVNELGKRLNPDGSKDSNGYPAPLWVDTSSANSDQLYVIRQGLFTPATSSSTTAIFMGAFWGWYVFQNDGAQGMHNYKFAYDYLTNINRVLDQCASKGMITSKWW